MIVVVADTSGLLAALDDDHPDRKQARRALRSAGTLVVSPVLLSEFDHVARRVIGWQAALSAVDDIAHWTRAGRAVIPTITADSLDIAQSVRHRYADLNLDLADAVNVVLAAEFRTNAVFTLDRRGFRALRPLTAHEAFVLLPEDLPPDGGT